VAQNSGEGSFGILSGESVNIRVAKSVGDDLYSNFVGFGCGDHDFDHLDWLVRFEGYSCPTFDC